MMKNAKVFMNDCASDVTKFCSTYDRSKPTWKRNCIEAQDPSKLSKACLVALNTIKESVSPDSSAPKTPEVSVASVSSTEELFNEFIKLMNEYKKTHGTYSYDFNDFQTHAYTIPITVTIYSPMECLKKFNQKAKKFSFSTFPNLKIEKLNKKEATDALMFYEVTNKMQAGNYEGKLCLNNTDNFWLGATVLKADGKIDSYTLRKTGAILLKDKPVNTIPNVKAAVSDSYLIKTCESGDMKACGLLGYHLEKQGKTEEAKKLYERACDAANLESCIDLGILTEKQGNSDEAKKLYARACDGGVLFGCSRLGTLEEELGHKKEAKILYTKACDGGYLSGCDRLGIMEFVYGDKSIAKKLFIKACDGGVMSGCSDLGLLLIDEGNKTEAKKFLKMGCDAGFNASCKNLNKLSK